MKVVGLLGGMSWESSIEYERIINEEVRRRLGGVHSAELVIRSFDFSVIESLQSSGDWNQAGRLLAEAAAGLEAAGADLVLLCTNTMHRVADQVSGAVDIPLLHIADATAAAVTSAGLTRVGLLGTRYTMEQDFYSGRLEAHHGITVIIPDESDRTLVHRVIYEELVQGIILDASRRGYLAVIDRLRQRGAEGIIAGCTEIELLVQPADVALPYFPSTRLHAVAAVDAALIGDAEGGDHPLV